MEYETEYRFTESDVYHASLLLRDTLDKYRGAKIVANHASLKACGSPILTGIVISEDGEEITLKFA
jgi:hypothetical protein